MAKKNTGPANRRGLQACKSCSARFAKDKLRCPACGSWNTASGADGDDDTVVLSDAAIAPLIQLQTGPWDPCFGQQGDMRNPTYGLVTTGVVLLGGQPGAGKSTVSLQLADAVVQATGREVIYVEAEESIGELKARAVRLQILNMAKIRVIPMGSTSDMSAVFHFRKPSAIIVDSLQGMCDNDLDSQVEFCKALKEHTVALNAPGVIISQVTKECDFAGAMALQHAVDVTVMFTGEGEEIRELRTIKNRFGPAGVVRYFDMTPDKGLVLCEPPDEAETDG